MNLVELQNKIHAQNKELGWWDEPRPFSTFVCLFHSELSEAMEGDRKGLMDDHLPQYPMASVEVADFVIRVLDWYGSVDVGIIEFSIRVYDNWDFCDYIAMIHQKVSAAYYFKEIADTDFCEVNEELSEALMLCQSLYYTKGWNLEQIILEKVEYNKHRADHKRENRAKVGGKKY